MFEKVWQQKWQNQTWAKSPFCFCGNSFCKILQFFLAKNVAFSWKICELSLMHSKDRWWYLERKFSPMPGQNRWFYLFWPKINVQISIHCCFLTLIILGHHEKKSERKNFERKKSNSWEVSPTLDLSKASLFAQSYVLYALRLRQAVMTTQSLFLT